MSKKQKALDAQLADKNSAKQDQISQGVVVKGDKKQDKNSKDKKKDIKKKDRKDKEKKSIARKTKETVSELKKVTWPTFGEVVKKTGIVIVFVLIFGLFLFGVNTLLGWLAGLLVTVA